MKRRYSKILSLLVLNVMLIPGISGAAPTSAQDTSERPDLPAMLLRGEQIADAGIEDQLFPAGNGCRTAAQQANLAAKRLGLSPDELTDQLTDAGWQVNCGQAYGRPAPGGASGSPAPPDLIITSYVIAYDDADGAELGFDLLEDESSDPDAEDLPEGNDFAKQSEATLTSGFGNNGLPFRSLDLTFRLDNLVAGVTIRNEDSRQVPDYGTAESLAQALEDRIGEILDKGAPGLSTLVPRMEGDNLSPTNSDRYTFIDGSAEQAADESDEEFDQRIDGYGESEAVYIMTQRIPAGADGPNDDFVYGTTLYQFPDDASAEDWLGRYPDHLTRGPDNFDVVVRDDAPQFGDESVSIGWGQTLSTGQAVINDRILARVGDVGVSIGFRGPIVPIGIAEEVIEAQVACIEDGACPDPIAVPDALSGAGQAAAETSEDNAEETPAREAATESPVAANAGQETYTSDLYPYSLSYSESWTLEEVQVAGDAEIIALSNDASSVVMIADVTHRGDVEDCLDNAIAYVTDEPDNSDIKVMEDADGEPLKDSESDLAFAVYSYTNADGIELAAYIECRALVAGESTLEFNHFFLAADYDEQAKSREELLGGLEIGE